MIYRSPPKMWIGMGMIVQRHRLEALTSSVLKEDVVLHTWG